MNLVSLPCVRTSAFYSLSRRQILNHLAIDPNERVLLTAKLGNFGVFPEPAFPFQASIQLSRAGLPALAMRQLASLVKILNFIYGEVGKSAATILRAMRKRRPSADSIARGSLLSRKRLQPSEWQPVSPTRR